MAISPQTLIKEWWDYYQPDPRASYDNIVSGMRKEESSSGSIEYPGGVTQPIGKSQKQTGGCQYFIKGLPAPCSYWQIDQTTTSGICSYSFENPEDRPSGYGTSGCDGLGRRDWCNKYVASKTTDLNEFVCVAPCIERSGMGKQVTSADTLMFRPLLPAEIQGYNMDSETGVGKCDGWGMGRGDQKDSFESLEDIYTYRPICKFYRPQQMGFGAIQPHPFHGSDAPGKPYDGDVNWVPQTLEELHDGTNADPLVAMDKRLPFAFQIYNARAMYQKCAHWKNQNPSFFVISDESDISLQTIEMSDESYCEYYETEESNHPSTPFYKISDDWPAGVPWVLVDVWAPYGGIVCNGAKPECPCYTGKWVYCTDNNLRDGMRISADQIFELRFWASNWSSKEEYEEFYLAKPGPTSDDYADESTADIYTFVKWQKLDPEDPNNSKMLGYKHTMCMPAPLHMREFDPDQYITKDLHSYPTAAQITGTNMPGQVAFPTLVRELDNPNPFVPEINVIYPYYTLDPWEVEVCQEEDVADFSIHNTNLMADPTVSVVGDTVSECEIYVINKDIIDSAPEVSRAVDYMNDYYRAAQIANLDTDVWYDYNDKVDKLIEYARGQEKGFYEDTTSEYGFFQIDDVVLKINSLNHLYIICKYASDPFPEYIFRKVQVLNQYWGALITQGRMDHTHYSTGINAFPEAFTPPVSLTGHVQTTRGTVSSVIPLYYHHRAGIYFDRTYYGYCINEYEVEELDLEKWVQIGPTGYIWCEFDNIDLSYLWDFTITEAYMELNTIEDEDGQQKNKSINLCDDEPAGDDTVRINLTRIGISRRNIPPNAALFYAGKPMPFFNDDWKLVVKYKYRLLETERFVVVWPSGFDSAYSSVQFRESPYSVEHIAGSSDFSIPSLGSPTLKATPAVMAFVTDDDGRVQTAAATKMLMQGYRQGNLNIEIDYAYAAAGTSYSLEPTNSFYTWRGAPQIMSDDSGGGSYRHTFCGDHDCNPDNCMGPMWYPFESCSDGAYYDFYCPAAICLLAIIEGEEEVEKMGVGAWRYGVADMYNCWVTEAGNWAATCGASWNYYYSMSPMSAMRWAGAAKKRAVINTMGYEFNGWALPPFGNSGRAYIERFLSKDLHSFIDMSQTQPTVKEEYMPYVFTYKDLVTDMNCFSYGTYTGGTINYFPMLSNYTASYVNESVSNSRYRFSDIINVILQKGCSYPAEMVQTANGYHTCRYGFKNENHVWAWPEYWKPIERNKNSSHGKFNFLDIYQPSYLIDGIRMEHRLITDEGDHVLIFEPPTAGDEEGEDDDSGTYPSICLDGTYPRYFDIFYTDFSSGYVDWKDESSTGEIGSSDGQSIYELANNGSGLNGEFFVYNLQWVHSYNTLFDAFAEKEPNEDRMFYFGFDEILRKERFGYYNRGLNAYIPKDRLQFLPMEQSSAGAPTTVTGSLTENTSYLGYWDLEGAYGLAPVEIEVSGFYGKRTNADGSVDVFVRPAVGVVESEDDPEVDPGEVPDWSEGTPVGSLSHVDGRTQPELKRYEIKFELSKTPDRLTKKLMYFMVKLSGMTAQELFVTSFSVKLAKYVRAEEVIKVWERKYYVGEGTLSSPNADGPSTPLYRNCDRDQKLSGQYFPINLDGVVGIHYYGDTIDHYENGGDYESGTMEGPDEAFSSESLEGAGSVISKLTTCSYTEFKPEDEEIEITMDNLKEKEEELQAEAYSEATALESYDDLDFSGIQHPAIRGWLEQVGGSFSTPAAMKLHYSKVTWENSRYPAWLRQDGDFWQPGGHYFAWSDKVMLTKCYTLGPIQEVYDVMFIHHNHGPDEEVVWTGYAYAGWKRTEYLDTVLYTQAMLGLEERGYQADLLTGARNGIMGGTG